MSGKNNVIEQSIVETLEVNYMPYAMSVIISRAIPEIDGFKPAHRKLLYTMYKMGLLTGGRIKSADVVGQTMRLNPHGDSAIYETLVRLTRGNNALLHPFIDSKGNFGKQYSKDMAYAASRYTEVKLDNICNELFKEIDNNTVDFVDNYNGTTKEPLLFPTTFPNLLVTPNQGIAVGMASSICSFNLAEVCNATIAFIKDSNCNLLDYLIAPDFSTGGELIYKKEELENIYKTGRGTFKVRAKYTYDKKNNCIEIYEIPYTTTLEVIIDKIVTLARTNKIREINDVRDETGLDGLKITIDVKRNCDPHMLMKKLYSLTTLSDSFNCNFNILVGGRPKTMGISEILTEWLNFRIECVRRLITFDINKKQEKLHLLEGLSKILLNIDKVIQIIRNTEEEKEVIPNLMSEFKIDEIQADFIAEIKLRNLNKEYLLKRISELENLKKDIEDLENKISSEESIKSVICQQLKEVIKKYKKDRKTTIVYDDGDESDISVEMFIEDYPIKVFLTEHNYFKKIQIQSLRSASTQYLKDDDRIIQEIESTNKSTLLMFSSLNNVYKVKAHDLSECKASSLGEYLTNVLDLSEDEKIIFMASIIDYKGYIIFGYENGKIAKVNIESYSTKVNRKKLVNAFSEKSKLVFAQHIYDDKDYIVVRDTDKALLFSTSLLSPTNTKNSLGVQVYSLKKNSVVTKIIPKDEFISKDIEHYRTNTIPSTGHFLLEDEIQSII